MTSPIDPNEIRVTGENSFIRLYQQEGGPEVTRASHWRVLWSPGGPGHVLYLKSGDLTAGKVRIYSDNPSMARWLQGEIESMLFPEFADESVPVVHATFAREGDQISFSRELVQARDDTIQLTWWDFLTPIMVSRAAGSMPIGPHGVYTVLIPGRGAQVMVNDVAAAGQVVPDKRGDRDASSACLAWSETWVRP